MNDWTVIELPQLNLLIIKDKPIYTTVMQREWSAKAMPLRETKMGGDTNDD